MMMARSAGGCEECALAATSGRSTMPERIKEHRAGHPRPSRLSDGKGSQAGSERRGSQPDSIGSAVYGARSASATTVASSVSESSGRGSPTSASANGAAAEAQRFHTTSPGPTASTDINGVKAQFLPSITIRHPPGPKLARPDSRDTPSAGSSSRPSSAHMSSSGTVTQQTDGHGGVGDTAAAASSSQHNFAGVDQEFAPPAIPYPNVTIEFCDRCRWAPRATWIQTELFLTFPTPALKAITLIPLTSPETGGRFRVWLDTGRGMQLLWDRKTEGGFPELKVLKQRLRNVIQPEKDLGHSDAQPKASADITNPPQSMANGTDHPLEKGQVVGSVPDITSLQV